MEHTAFLPLSQSRDLFTDHDVLLILGGDVGELYRGLKETLHEKEGRAIAFLQKRSEEFPTMAQEEIDPTIGEDARVFLFYLKDVDQEEVFKQIGWRFVFLRTKILNAFSKEQDAWATSVSSKLTTYLLGVKLLASDYEDLGVRVFDNIKNNLKQFLRASDGQKLFGAFAKIPAIICGAGPSLAKEIELLKDLTEKAFIFAGGSALNVFDAHALSSHFSASIDPDPLYMQMGQKSAKQAAFFYQSRGSYKLLNCVLGSLLWIPSSGGYPIEEWFMEKLEVKANPFDGGWNVATFCTALACAMGCDPIIFVGLDLASPTSDCYAPGVRTQALDDALIATKDEKGHTLYSRSDWLMAKEWVETFIIEHPAHTFINTSQEGLALHGSIYLPLMDAVEKYLGHSFNVKAMLNKELELLPKMGIKKEAIDSALKELEEGLEKVDAKCDAMLEQFSLVYPDPPFEKGAYILLEVELEEETVFQKILQPLWNIWSHFFANHLPDNLSNDYSTTLNRLLFYKKVLAAYRSFR